jgi:hypothetical protein
VPKHWCVIPGSRDFSYYTTDLHLLQGDWLPVLRPAAESRAGCLFSSTGRNDVALTAYGDSILGSQPLPCVSKATNRVRMVRHWAIDRERWLQYNLQSSRATSSRAPYRSFGSQPVSTLRCQEEVQTSGMLLSNRPFVRGSRSLFEVCCGVRQSEPPHAAAAVHATPRIPLLQGPNPADWRQP